MPSEAQRLQLWEDNFRGKPYPLAPEVDLDRLARDYEISGGSIINVLRYACLRSILRYPPEVQPQDLFDGIRRELHKDGRLTR